MLWRIEVRKTTFDPEARAVEREARELGIRDISPVRIARIYYIDGAMNAERAERVAADLLADPVCETACVVEAGVAGSGIEVLHHPGVMDPSVESIVRALKDQGLGNCAVRTGKAYELARSLPSRERDLLVRGVLLNPVIQRLALPGEVVFAHPRPCRYRRRTVRLRNRTERELERLSRKGLLALSVNEMKAIRRHYARLRRDPTDVELETFAQTWSEHCQHKTFRGEVVVDGRSISNLLKATIFRVLEELKTPWVLSAFHDNSGVIALDERYGVSFKVETHNHPSALEPYGGASTGVGGVIRDCLGTGLGARPILNTDVFCFGHLSTPAEDVPAGVLHPRRVMRGVVAGVRDYGNRMGIPTANGAVYFDDGYVGNPLVFCGTLGLIPRDRLVKKVRAGQLIVLMGGRTGRDGIHGVTFASLELNQETAKAASAVQIGNPIEEKRLCDVVLAARDRGLFSAITDCGGGGLSSAVGEMASRHGCEVNLDLVPLKYQGLSPAEIWISEAQERMVLFVEPAAVQKLLALAHDHDVEATVIGRVTGTGRLVLNFRQQQVADVSMRFLHHGWQGVKRVGTWRPPEVPEPFVRPDADLSDVLRKLLASPNIASKEWIIHQYDHEVQAGSAMKPLSGREEAGPTDACVVMPLPDSRRACVVACGLCPRYGLVDPYWMAASAIDEALRNCVAAGGDIERTALLDNFCWGSPERPDQLAGLVRAAQACYDIGMLYQTPFISGKDSLYNELRTGDGHAFPIPPTLLVSALSVIPDAAVTVTPDFKSTRSLVYVVGETLDELGGSEYLRLQQGLGRRVPRVDARRGRRLMRALGKAIRLGLVSACHDMSEGGLAVAVVEMTFSSGIGCRIALERVPGAHRFRRDDFLLFSESNTRFVCEVPSGARAGFERAMQGIPHALVGRTQSGAEIVITALAGGVAVNLDVAEARAIWRRTLTKWL